MKVLWLCPFVPYPLDNGGNIRVFHMLAELTKLHDVTLVCFRSSLQGADDLSVLRELCNEVILLDLPAPLPLKLHHLRDFFSWRPASLVIHEQRILEELMKITSTQTFDLLHVEFMPLAELASELPIMIKTLAEHYLTIESYAFNIEKEKGLRRWYFQRELHKLKCWEPAILSRYSHVFVTSEPHLKKIGSWVGDGCVSLVPNGVDLEFFKPQPTERSEHSFLYMGSFLLDAANLRGLTFLLNNVFPLIKKQLPDASLHIVGRGVPEEIVKQSDVAVTFHDYVEDVRPLLAEASAMLMPIVGGSGTKLRVLTAMAMKQVVVSTVDGIAGLECLHDKEVLIAHSWEEMADQAVSVALNGDLHERLALAAQDLAQRYSWISVARRQGEIWQQLMEEKA